MHPMPMRRTLAGLVLVVTALGPLLVSAPAGAALPDRQISSKVIETKRNQLFLKGRVTPDYAEKQVIIQKRNCLKPKCDWFRHATVQTNETGGFRSKIYAPRRGSDFWRAKVEAQGDYGTSYSQTWRTWTS